MYVEVAAVINHHLGFKKNKCLSFTTSSYTPLIVCNKYRNLKECTLVSYRVTYLHRRLFAVTCLNHTLLTLFSVKMFIFTVFFPLFIAHGLVSSEYIFKGFDEKFTPEWWQSNIIYQVYVRSFKDTDGDGIGDLNGTDSHFYFFLTRCPLFFKPKNIQIQRFA